MLYSVAVFAPLAGAMVAGLFGPAIGDRAAELATIIGMLVSAIAGVIVMAIRCVPGRPLRERSDSRLGRSPAPSRYIGRCVTIRFRL